VRNSAAALKTWNFNARKADRLFRLSPCA